MPFFDSSCAKPFVHPCYSLRKDIHGGKSKDRPYPIERFPLLLFVFLCQVICYYLLSAHDKKYRNPSYINKSVCFPSGRAADGSKNMDRNHLRIRLEVKNEEKRIDLGFFYIYVLYIVPAASLCLVSTYQIPYRQMQKIVVFVCCFSL